MLLTPLSNGTELHQEHTLSMGRGLTEVRGTP